MYVLRTEDCTHIWAKQPDSPVLQRLELTSPLQWEQLLHLCMAGPLAPVTVRGTVGAWGGDGFITDLVEIDVPQKPVITSRRKHRQRFGKTMLL